jgi:hypothetical protein
LNAVRLWNFKDCGAYKTRFFAKNQHSQSEKNTKKAFLACFWAYVRQPDNHIGLVTSIPFASIYPTHPRNQSLEFLRKNIENLQNWKTPFFWVGHFDFFFSKMAPWKSVQIYRGMNGSNFWWLPWFSAQNNTCAKMCNTKYLLCSGLDVIRIDISIKIVDMFSFILFEKLRADGQLQNWNCRRATHSHKIILIMRHPVSRWVTE